MNLLQFAYSHVLPICVLVMAVGCIPFAMPYFGFIDETATFIYYIRHENIRDWFRMKDHYYKMGWSSVLWDVFSLMVGICTIITVVLVIFGRIYQLNV